MKRLREFREYPESALDDAWPWDTDRHPASVLRSALRRAAEGRPDGGLLVPGSVGRRSVPGIAPGWPYCVPHVNRHAELAICLEGSAAMLLGTAHAALRPGDVCLIPTGILHNECWLHPDLPYTLLWLIPMGGAALLTRSTYVPKPSRFDVRGCALVAHVDEASLAAAEVAALAGGHEGMASIGRSLSAYLRAVAAARWRMRAELPAPLAETLAMVRERFDGPLRLATMAAAARTNPRHLAWLLHAYTGTTAAACIRAARLQHAMYLLATTDVPLAEVARQSGYPDPKYFSRKWSEWAGVAPSSVRAALQGAASRRASQLSDWRGPGFVL